MRGTKCQRSSKAGKRRLQPKIKRRLQRGRTTWVGPQEWVGICLISALGMSFGQKEKHRRQFGLAIGSLMPVVSSSTYAQKHVSLYKHLKKSISYSLLPPKCLVKKESTVGTEEILKMSKWPKDGLSSLIYSNFISIYWTPGPVSETGPYKSKEI